MKICKKIEDFDEMENGFGLKLKVKGDIVQVIVISSGDLLINFCGEDKYTSGHLKTMGFKFEWSWFHKLSLEEVLEKYQDKSFEQCFDNYYLIQDKVSNLYSSICYVYTEVIGAKCYDKKTIDKIIEELNG